MFYFYLKKRTLLWFFLLFNRRPSNQTEKPNNTLIFSRETTDPLQNNPFSKNWSSWIRCSDCTIHSETSDIKKGCDTPSPYPRKFSINKTTKIPCDTHFLSFFYRNTKNTPLADTRKNFRKRLYQSFHRKRAKFWQKTKAPLPNILSPTGSSNSAYSRFVCLLRHFGIVHSYFRCNYHSYFAYYVTMLLHVFHYQRLCITCCD